MDANIFWHCGSRHGGEDKPAALLLIYRVFRAPTLSRREKWLRWLGHNSAPTLAKRLLGNPRMLRQGTLALNWYSPPSRAPQRSWTDRSVAGSPAFSSCIALTRRRRSSCCLGVGATLLARSPICRSRRKGGASSYARYIRYFRTAALNMFELPQLG